MAVCKCDRMSFIDRPALCLKDFLLNKYLNKYSNIEQIFFLFFFFPTTQQYIFPCKLFLTAFTNTTLHFFSSFLTSKYMFVFALSLLKDCIRKIALELLILFIHYYCIHFYYSVRRKECLLIKKQLTNEKRSRCIDRETESKRDHSSLTHFSPVSHFYTP